MDKQYSGFTLIELSIVLVIIGLIVGGVLVGQNLIAAAGVRATVTQIEKYNTAVNTFRGKYGALPGDLNQATATQFGFAARGSLEGQGDGNGVLENNQNGGTVYNAMQGGGEIGMFWVDLSTANGLNVDLIDGSFSTATETSGPSATNMDLYLPQAKIGGGNYIYVFSINGLNYYGLSAATSFANGFTSNLGLTVQQAYSIDKKVDDGLPQTGTVLAGYVTSSSPQWPGGGGTFPSVDISSGVAGSATTCYDNGNTAYVSMSYSLEINNGAGVNCALSFQFQ